MNSRLSGPTRQAVQRLRPLINNRATGLDQETFSGWESCQQATSLRSLIPQVDNSSDSARLSFPAI
ncbi:Uncharacterised protein [Vibrio cholerae]|nr:Uncharacterised protein [Vibrio cholerae]